MALRGQRQRGAGVGAVTLSYTKGQQIDNIVGMSAGALKSDTRPITYLAGQRAFVRCRLEFRSGVLRFGHEER